MKVWLCESGSFILAVYPDDVERTINGLNEFPYYCEYKPNMGMAIRDFGNRFVIMTEKESIVAYKRKCIEC